MNTIDIAVVALPDGQVLHCEAHSANIQKEIDSWKRNIPKKRLNEYDDFTYGGVVQIRMLKKDWDKIK